MPVWLLHEGIEDYCYWGQGHKICYYKDKKADIHQIKLKRVAQQEDKEKAKKLKKCMFCLKPLLQENYRDAVKDHCHITCEFRGAAHSACNSTHHLMQAMSTQKGADVHRQQHGDIHHVYNKELEIYRQCGILFEKPGCSGKINAKGKAKNNVSNGKQIVI